MGVKEVTVHMTVGNGASSYANNSEYQKIGISKANHILDECLKEMVRDHGIPKCFKMVDLGCSSGPNTLSVIAQIVDTMERLRKMSHNVDELPEMEVFLNDLGGNDFNNLFKLLPSFYETLKQVTGNKEIRCFVSGLPGSFYDRLFPINTLNFVYSSFSLHWLSKTPEGLESNKENIHMAMASPPEVFEAYKRQYRKDFTTFLSSRGEEMMHGGRMVLTFVGRSVEDPSTRDDCAIISLLANSLLELVNEGVVKKSDLHAFNMPIYTPSKREVEEVIDEEGSFNLDRFESFLLRWDAHVEQDQEPILTSQVVPNASAPDYRRGKLVSDSVRAFTEPVLESHFGSSIVDNLYGRLAKKLAEYLSMEESSLFNIIICLRKK